MTIAPRIYRSSGKPITSYGMNIIGTKGCEKEYPWWSDFAKACREGGP
jgi:hypothetical protein